MTDTQILFLGFGLIAAAILAVVGSQLAPADTATGLVPVKSRWNWAAGAAFATVVNLGLLFQSLDLGQGLPSGARAGWVGIGVMCAVFAALVAYVVHRGEARGPRWRKTGIAFSATMAVIAVVEMVVA
ncbi:hypothetical protein AB0M39_02220 [Streptomyces sp. NPDC051907]|uniref:hypothetical protein n=1 Tax=Streptomyces sp. NPDC051907 TaxID=3155284 RepID=UPI00342E225D